MAGNNWPVLPDAYYYDSSNEINYIRMHCLDMAAHAMANPQSFLQASAVKELAIAAFKAISDLSTACKVSRENGDLALNKNMKMEKAMNARLEAKTETLPASGTAPITPLDDISNQSSSSSPKSPSTDSSAGDWPPVPQFFHELSFPDNHKRVRVHWDELPSYLNGPIPIAIEQVQSLVYDAGLNVQISRIQMLPTGDMNVYTSSREGADVLVAYSDKWITDLPGGKWARVIDSRWFYFGVPCSVLLLPRTDAARQIKLQNPRVSKAYIPYVWAGDGSVSRNPTFRNALLVSFDRPEDANAILQIGELDLNGCRFKAEKFAIYHQFLQCTQCQGFGHLKRQCTLPTRCRYCSHKHRERYCPRPQCYRCANCCGLHPADSKVCRLRKLAVKKVRKLQKHKNFFYPMTKAEAAPVPPAEGQVKPSLAKRSLPPDSTEFTSAQSNNNSGRPEKRRRSDRTEAPNYDSMSEWPFEEDYPSEPEYSETESETDPDDSTTTNSAEQSTASDSDSNSEPSSPGSPWPEMGLLY